MNLSEFINELDLVVLMGEGRKPYPDGTRTTRKNGTYEKQSGKWIRVKGESGGAQKARTKPAGTPTVVGADHSAKLDPTLDVPKRQARDSSIAANAASTEARLATRVRGLSKGTHIMKMQQRAAAAHYDAADQHDALGNAEAAAAHRAQGEKHKMAALQTSDPNGVDAKGRDLGPISLKDLGL